MAVQLTDIIGGADPARRDLAVEQWCAGKSLAELLAAAAGLDTYRKSETNLYHRVRALFFLSALHRYHLPARAELPRSGLIPHLGHTHLLERRF